MAEVTLTIGDRRHVVACRPGGEDQLQHVSMLLDQRWAAANRAAGGQGGERTMLFVALMLADALDEAERHPPQPASDAIDPDALVALAERLESLAERLEK
jgi:cell division protein ZapA